jgi:hypothetical protein
LDVRFVLVGKPWEDGGADQIVVAMRKGGRSENDIEIPVFGSGSPEGGGRERGWILDQLVAKFRAPPAGHDWAHWSMERCRDRSSANNALDDGAIATNDHIGKVVVTQLQAAYYGFRHPEVQ